MHLLRHHSGRLKLCAAATSLSIAVRTFGPSHEINFCNGVNHRLRLRGSVKLTLFDNCIFRTTEPSATGNCASERQERRRFDYFPVNVRKVIVKS